MKSFGEMRIVRRSRGSNPLIHKFFGTIKMVKRGVVKMVNIFHYNDKTGQYKKLTVELDPKGRGVFVTVTNGTKGDKKNIQRVTILCNKMELAYLILELQEIYRKIGDGGE